MGGRLLGDICDFTLHTSGGGPPQLTPLNPINNVPSRIIKPVCVGACNYLFFVNPQPGGCEPTYVWTLDGDELGEIQMKYGLIFRIRVILYFVLQHTLEILQVVRFVRRKVPFVLLFKFVQLQTE